MHKDQVHKDAQASEIVASLTTHTNRVQKLGASISNPLTSKSKIHQSMVYNCTRAPHVSYLILEEPN
jgi:hypothetical protein